jgi:serine/threonine protein kinase
MIADDGVTPILMDFGSCMKARIPIESRTHALLQQDIAAEHSTMAYRAPELFDVKTGIAIDEKVDIWVYYPPHYFLPLTKFALRSLWAAFCSPLHTSTPLSRIRRQRNKAAQ